MENDGTNKYKIKHMSKDKHIRQGLLPEVIVVDEELVNKVWDLSVSSEDSD